MIFKNESFLMKKLLTLFASIIILHTGLYAMEINDSDKNDDDAMSLFINNSDSFIIGEKTNNFNELNNQKASSFQLKKIHNKIHECDDLHDTSIIESWHGRITINNNKSNLIKQASFHIVPATNVSDEKLTEVTNMLTDMLKQELGNQGSIIKIENNSQS